MARSAATNQPQEKPGGEGWQVSDKQQLLCQFKADSAKVHAQWRYEIAVDQAEAAGAVAMFGEEDAAVVRVVDIPGVSMELCGGWEAAVRGLPLVIRSDP